mmetsp:Transcript_2784/g.4525  ORF Transcript_2784/g.4525 Transcript_2784/m.4525 type:complete len:150 (-) Transcript_2784:333-782(-)|eukprot:CAMPEP_0206153402 /NCGR_PEP_ID=MMETSP1474-20131121/617_1 /ASSEMBLY_ACC=CAM_ASM_001110 /TAXON_ID=97495 /ORGANISM="Imantonia sp., Strain RCC918" /LENGTH=149 /DNA_ID=CAMNT_0053551209 /DNA_START=17 /DNA_END=466 /DNA_ORIENTATION=-
MLRLAAARPLARAAARSVVAPRVRCMHDDFKPQTKSYAAPSITVHEQIQKDIDTDPVVVFMKGVPDAPMCGFSNTVVQIMKAEGVSFKGYNVLASPELREGIKEFSSWPTIPQVYIKGEFIGGCDVTMEMYKSGELRKLLQDAGLKATE